MQEISLEKAVDQVRAKDSRYSREAYLFLREALDHTRKLVAKDGRGRRRHVTGQELLVGIREYALSQFGPMAMTVLNEWGIHACLDFGEIVFNLIDAGWLAKTKEDSKAHFEGGYTFDEAFRQPFLPSDKQCRLPREPRITKA
jgi:uncharacterized repeat protein (TIGR04138 family)